MSAKSPIATQSSTESTISAKSPILTQSSTESTQESKIPPNQGGKLKSNTNKKGLIVEIYGQACAPLGRIVFTVDKIKSKTHPLLNMDT